jgi:UPF0176 protein
LFHISFYRFVAVDDPELLREQLLGLTVGLLGSILVAHEGINGMLVGSAEQLDVFETAVQSGEVCGGAFAGMAFKRTVADADAFRRRKIKVKPHLVPLDVVDADVVSRAADIDATTVDPKEWRELLQRDDVVALDNRNSFEFEHGHFRGAVDPGTVDFRDFANYVRAHADEWRINNTTIAMYCTGGIRCEKSSPWMQDLGLTVRQLRGGILTYLAEMSDAEQDWTGDCFVFDQRRLLDVHLQPVPLAVQLPLQLPLQRDGETAKAAENDGEGRDGGLAPVLHVAQRGEVLADGGLVPD